MRVSLRIPSLPRRSNEWKVLVGLLLFNGIGAVFGGIGLLTGSLAMPLDVLDGTPFDSYVVPAWILLVAVGGSSLLAAMLLIRRARYANQAAFIAGGVLLGWIVVEFILIPAGWMFQLVYFVVALLILWYARPETTPGD